MDNIIFLDFDGVLHPLGLYFHKDSIEYHQYIDGRAEWFCFNKILEDLLNNVEDSIGKVGIVVHSSWRESFEEENIKEFLGNDLGSRFLGCTDPGEKKKSIDDWLLKNNPKNWIVVDDFDDGFSVYGENFLICDSDWGISAPAFKNKFNNWASNVCQDKTVKLKFSK